jgi:hypothetical protein
MYIGLHVKYRYSCHILMELKFSRQIFEKSPNVEFHEPYSSGSQAIPCRRTDRHDEANSRFLQIFAYVFQTKAGLNEDD